MSSFYRQMMGATTPVSCVAIPSKTTPSWRKGKRLRRRPLSCSLGGKGKGAEPIRPNPKFSASDLKRICTQGPSYEDLQQTHFIPKSSGLRKITEEKVSFVRRNSLGEGMSAEEPNWKSLQKISFMEFYKGVEERNWRSDFYDPDAPRWKISFFEDRGRLLRPSFNGYRTLIEEEGMEPVWCDMPLAGVDNYEEDQTVPREDDGLKSVVRTKELGYPGEYGYRQLFQRMAMAHERRIPERLMFKQGCVGYLSEKDVHNVMAPVEGLMDVSFHLTRREPSLHRVWRVVPAVIMVTFSLSFLSVCLFFGVFKPRKQMPADPIQAMEFAQSKGRARKDGRTGVRFVDIAGLENIINDLKELVEFLKEPAKYKRLNAKPPKGVLLEGPPGTGKTLIAKAIAGEAGVPFYQMSGSEFVEAIVGVGAARVRDLFKRASAQEEACIIFVDEIDALGSKRAEAGILTNEEREQTLNQLLTEMDGFSSETGVVFVAATNRADLLDPALTRPGRFDRKLRVMRPDTEGRHQILQLHAKKFKLDPEVDLLQLARDLPGLAGAELANVLNESALEAIRQDGDVVTSTDVYNAVDRVLEGIRQPAQPAESLMGRMFAVHEMGRGIVATVLRERTGRLEAVEKLSIVARGRDDSRTVFFRGKDEDYTMTTRSRMLERIRVILAGRAAEEYYLKNATTYGAKDLGPAFRLAEKVVANYGLTEIGITSYAPIVRNSAAAARTFEVNTDNIDEDLFGKSLQGGMFQSCDSSFHKMLTKCYEILWEAHEESLEIIASHSNALDAGSKILLEKLEMSGAEVAALIKKYPPKPLKKPLRREDYTICPQQIPSPLSLKYRPPTEEPEPPTTPVVSPVRKVEETAVPS